MATTPAATQSISHSRKRSGLGGISAMVKVFIDNHLTTRHNAALLKGVADPTTRRARWTR
jgi:hypothetical protein